MTKKYHHNPSSEPWRQTISSEDVLDRIEVDNQSGSSDEILMADVETGFSNRIPRTQYF